MYRVGLYELFLAKHCIFGGFGDLKFDNLLCLYLDGLACCKVPSHSSFYFREI